MKTNKVLGPNSISTKVLKMSQQISAKPLAYLLNFSFFLHSSFPRPVKNIRY